MFSWTCKKCGRIFSRKNQWHVVIIKEKDDLDKRPLEWFVKVFKHRTKQ